MCIILAYCRRLVVLGHVGDAPAQVFGDGRVDAFVVRVRAETIIGVLSCSTAENVADLVHSFTVELRTSAPLGFLPLSYTQFV